MTDWALSTVWYGSVLGLVIASIAVIRPIRTLRLTTRRRAAGLVAVAVTGIALTLLVLPAEKRAQPGGRRIDAYAPTYHFRETHSRTVEASPTEVLAAVKGVTAGEIALFQLFTSIRRMGRPGPESILNAPERMPILDVATRSGFLMLSDDADEVVVGAIVAAPRGYRPSRRPDAQWFQQVHDPGVVKATMNFHVTADGAARTLLTTETRVIAGDEASLRRFTPYWRTIFPGSWILRVTWLRAIAARAR